MKVRVLNFSAGRRDSSREFRHPNRDSALAPSQAVPLPIAPNVRLAIWYPVVVTFADLYRYNKLQCPHHTNREDASTHDMIERICSQRVPPITQRIGRPQISCFCIRDVVKLFMNPANHTGTLKTTSSVPFAPVTSVMALKRFELRGVVKERRVVERPHTFVSGAAEEAWIRDRIGGKGWSPALTVRTSSIEAKRANKTRVVQKSLQGAHLVFHRRAHSSSCCPRADPVERACLRRLVAGPQ